MLSLSTTSSDSLDTSVGVGALHVGDDDADAFQDAELYGLDEQEEQEGPTRLHSAEYRCINAWELQQVINAVASEEPLYLVASVKCFVETVFLDEGLIQSKLESLSLSKPEPAEVGRLLKRRELARDIRHAVDQCSKDSAPEIKVNADWRSPLFSLGESLAHRSQARKAQVPDRPFPSVWLDALCFDHSSSQDVKRSVADRPSLVAMTTACGGHVWTTTLPDRIAEGSALIRDLADVALWRKRTQQADALLMRQKELQMEGGVPFWKELEEERPDRDPFVTALARWGWLNFESVNFSGPTLVAQYTQALRASSAEEQQKYLHDYVANVQLHVKTTTALLRAMNEREEKWLSTWGINVQQRLHEAKLARNDPTKYLKHKLLSFRKHEESI